MNPLHRAVASLMWVAGTLAPASLRAQAPAFEWAKLLTPTEGVHQLKSMTADSGGHAVIAYQRMYQSPEGILQTKSFLSNVVAKVDSRGNVLWTHGLLPNILRLATDGQGRTYVAGGINRLLPTWPLVPGNYLETVGITPEGKGGAYVARLSEDGHLDWVRLLGGATTIQATHIAVDAAGNYIVGGRYTSSAMQFDGIELPAPVPTSATHLFIAKFAPDGQMRWVRTGVGSYCCASLTGLGVDRAGNVVVGANLGDQTYAVAGVPVAAPEWEPVLIQFDPEGNLAWSASPGGSMIAVDPGGSVYAARDWRMMKYGPDGVRQWEWTLDAPTVLGGMGGGYGGGVGVDAEGNCVVAGEFRSQSSPEGNRLPSGDLVLGDTVLTTIAAQETFVAKFSSDGRVAWATQSEGQGSSFDFWTHYEQGDTSFPESITSTFALAVAPDGAVLISGRLSGPVRFGEMLVDGLSPVSRWDGVVAVGYRSPIFAARLVETAPSQPGLVIERAGNGLRLGWPAGSEGFVLESADSVVGGTWTAVPGTPALEKDREVLEIQQAESARFFRLRKR